MKNKDPRIADILKEIKRLNKELACAQKELGQVTSRDLERSFKYQVDDLRARIGWLLMDCGEFEKGLALYQLISWYTHGEEKYNGISRALVEMEYYTEAGKLLRRGLQRFPDSLYLLVAAGMLNRRLNNQYEALNYFERSLEIMPDDRHALYDKSLCLDNLCYYEDAAAILKDLTEQYPDDPEYLIEAGRNLLLQGYPEDSLNYYRSARDTGYLSPYLYNGFFCAYMDMGMKNDALEIATEGLKEFPDTEPFLYANLGEIYHEKGWTDEAKEILQKGLKKFPDDEDIKELLNKIEEDEKDPDKGKKPPIGSLLILLAIIMNKLRKKW